MNHCVRKASRCQSEDVAQSSCGASYSAWPCTVWIVAPRVAKPGSRCRPDTSEGMLAKANSSILQRLAHLSHWFASPILWFEALYGRCAESAPPRRSCRLQRYRHAAIGGRKSRDGIRLGSVHSSGCDDRLFTLGAGVSREDELNYRSWRARLCSQVAGGAVPSGRAQVHVFRLVSIALSIRFMRVSLSNGLLRKPKAPASIARVRIRSSGNAVMKMIGMW
jgi:hypothetical protein